MKRVKLELYYRRNDGATATIESFATEHYAGRTAANEVLWSQAMFLEDALLAKGYEREGYSTGPDTVDRGIVNSIVTETAA